VDALIELYDAWHAAEPNKGYDAKAAEWRGKLAVTSKPASQPAKAVPGVPENAP